MKKNNHNPFLEETAFSFILKEKSAVSIELCGCNGTKLFSVIDDQSFSAGIQEVRISGNHLNSGKYTAKITVGNSQGLMTENIEVTVN